MKYYLPHFAVFVGLPILLFAEINKVPTIPTRAEADAIIATEMQDRLSREADRKATIESVPAFENGNSTTVIVKLFSDESLHHLPRHKPGKNLKLRSPNGAMDGRANRRLGG